MKLVIFDIDGTLANLTHRLHHIKNGSRRWDEFFAEVKNDLPIHQIIELVRMVSGAGHHILLVSGRSEATREATVQWLAEHGVEYHEMYMRPDGDYRKDYIVKKEILAHIKKEFDDPEILFVVDDRSSVVKMWREEGLICLQCAEWSEEKQTDVLVKKGLLTLMVGPSGAGKSSWLNSLLPTVSMGIDSTHIISSDQIRSDLCGGNFRDQTRNTEVFSALRAVVKTRIEHGLPTVVDATNIKRADRLKIVELADGHAVRYIVIDRPLPDKLRDAGWRAEIPGLIERHHQTFQSQLKDVLAGDNLPNVEVIDLRKLV